MPGWTALQLEELCGLLVDALPGLAASGSAVVPLAEMDAVAGLSPGCTGGYSGTGHVVVHPSVFLSTAQRLIERTLDAPVVPAVLGSPPHKMTRRSSAPPPASPPHQSMGHYSNAGDGADPPHVLRVDTVLGMEMLYHVMFDVWDPRHMDAFRDSLSWVLRGAPPCEFATYDISLTFGLCFYRGSADYCGPSAAGATTIRPRDGCAGSTLSLYGPFLSRSLGPTAAHRVQSGGEL